MASISGRQASDYIVGEQNESTLTLSDNAKRPVSFASITATDPLVAIKCLPTMTGYHSLLHSMVLKVTSYYA